MTSARWPSRPKRPADVGFTFQQSFTNFMSYFYVDGAPDGFDATSDG